MKICQRLATLEVSRSEELSQHHDEEEVAKCSGARDGAGLFLGYAYVLR